MKIGLLGGSFDPVHKGHIKLGRSALRQLKLQKIFFVLAPRPPHKFPNVLAPVSARLKMLRLSLKGEKNMKVATWELKREGPSYTITTLKDLKRLHPRDEIFFIMGSDTFQGFGNWENPEGILRLAKVAVGIRPGTEKVAIKKGWRDRVLLLRGRFPRFSSREVREKWENPRLLEKVLKKPVVGFIRTTELYRHAHQ